MSLDQSEHGEPGPLQRLLRRLIVVHPEEVRVVLWCWLYIFSVLSSYYIMRPIRDQMGIAGGVNNLQWLFTGTLIGMLALNLPFAWLVTKLPRSRFIPITYHFFALNILLFAVALSGRRPGAGGVGRAHFFHLGIDLQSVCGFGVLAIERRPVQSRAGQAAVRLYCRRCHGRRNRRLRSYSGAGALCIANLSADRRGDLARNRCVQRRSARAIVAEAAPARRQARQNSGDTSRRSGAACGPALSTRYAHPTCWGSVPLCCCSRSPRPSFISSRPQSSAASFTDRGAQTAFFASVDLAVNVLTLVVQLLFTGRIVLGLGVGLALAVLPAITIVGFGALAFTPTLFAIALFQVIRRAGDYAIARPTREVLFTVVPREDRYKTKGFIDTFVYRLGDQVGAWSVALLRELGAGIAAGVAILIAGLWLLDAIWLGRREEVLEATRPAREAADD